MRPTTLTIAGADPTGGAGIQADLRTFEALGCRGTSAITAITVQDSDGVHGWEAVPVAVVRAQVETVLRDLAPVAVKTGMLATSDIVVAVADALRARAPDFVVVDPVLVSSSGYELLEENGIAALRTELLPLASLVTPNVPEAERLSGIRIETADDAVRAGDLIRQLGADAVLVTGGHLPGEPTDVLVTAGGDERFAGERVGGPDVHGTGCVFSAAAAAALAGGAALPEAIADAKRFTARLLRGELAS
jgi:hydroxymethylpyrimidine/phosphomethylpyrimidine kinase